MKIGCLGLKHRRQVPINFISYVGDASLVKEILGEIDMVAKSISMRVDDFIGSNVFIQTYKKWCSY